MIELDDALAEAARTKEVRLRRLESRIRQAFRAEGTPILDTAGLARHSVSRAALLEAQAAGFIRHSDGSVRLWRLVQPLIREAQS